MNAGHRRDEIVAAVQAQAAEMDLAPTFQMSHPIAFEAATKIAKHAPGDLKHIFFTNSARKPSIPRLRSRSRTTAHAAKDSSRG
ncbi:aminotransferase class-III [Burkholderia sp. BT03]|nr:aminotransferase class-III [Burkholderia sp. BT03]